MKKLISITILLCLTITGLNAQNVFKKNDVVLSVGIGLGTAVNLGRTIVPPISFNGEYCAVDNLFDAKSSIGIGAFVGFAAGKVDYYNFGNAHFTQKINSLMIGMRGALHYQFVDKLDTYAGIMLGGNIANVRSYGDWTNNNRIPGYGGFLGDFFIGARYYLHPNIAVYGELGFGVAYFTMGAAFKI